MDEKFWCLFNVFLLIPMNESWKMVLKFKPDVVVGTRKFVLGPLCLLATLNGTLVAIKSVLMLRLLQPSSIYFASGN